MPMLAVDPLAPALPPPLQPPTPAPAPALSESPANPSTDQQAEAPAMAVPPQADPSVFPQGMQCVPVWMPPPSYSAFWQGTTGASDPQMPVGVQSHPFSVPPPPIQSYSPGSTSVSSGYSSPDANPAQVGPMMLVPLPVYKCYLREWGICVAPPWQAHTHVISFTPETGTTYANIPGLLTIYPEVTYGQPAPPPPPEGPSEATGVVIGGVRVVESPSPPRHSSPTPPPSQHPVVTSPLSTTFPPGLQPDVHFSFKIPRVQRSRR